MQEKKEKDMIEKRGKANALKAKIEFKYTEEKEKKTKRKE